jgi:hypothetical protein
MPLNTKGLPDNSAPELRRLVDQLWSHEDVQVVIGSDPPAGTRVAERYVVAPSYSSAKMLLPADSHQARAKALSQYNRLRRGSMRAGRAMLSAAAHSRLDRAILRDLISVCVPVDASPATVAELLPVQHICDALERGPLVAAIGVANPSPNRKPTLQLFRPDGTPAAFVKIGWNDLTRAMVSNEAYALNLLDERGLTLPRRPKPALVTRWHDMSLLATEPMPLDLRRQPSNVCPQVDLSPLAPAGAPAVEPLESTPFWQRLTARAELMRASNHIDADEFTIVTSAMRRLEAACAGLSVPTQPWHGDWVHWNMATRAGELWVWDWEDFGDDAPRCFDALRFWFQHEFVVRERGFADAMDHATRMTIDDRARSHPREVAEAVPMAFVLETYLRAAWWHSLGADWYTRLRRPAIDWLARSAPLDGG